MIIFSKKKRKKFMHYLSVFKIITLPYETLQLILSVSLEF